MDVRAGGRPDAVLDHVDEGGHVVVGHLLAFEHVGHEDVVDRRRLGPAGRGVLGRHHADGGLGLGGQQLDLEPQPEAGGVGEQGGHVGRRVAGNHRTSSSTSSFDSAAAPGGDVAPDQHAVPADRLERGVGVGPGRRQGGRQRRHPEDPAPRRQERPGGIGPAGAGVEDGHAFDGGGRAARRVQPVMAPPVRGCSG